MENFILEDLNEHKATEGNDSILEHSKDNTDDCFNLPIVVEL